MLRAKVLVCASLPIYSWALEERFSSLSLLFRLRTFGPKPIDQGLASGVPCPDGYVQRCSLGIVGHPIQIRTTGKKIFGGAPIAARTGLPEGIVQLLR